ncbi:hypothetical protein [Vibrio neptunius]|uniref:hypothetical protein n=1 Tax=Vibrio neptunius TaxID=170651 RepID=UPI001C5CBC38|nr:hypothetical protein [Vibrio neptunius]QXX05653.1 hypothetical protein KW548_10570 [Vibrio neptunius]
MIQVDKQGRIISINAPQPSTELIRVDAPPAPEVLAHPEHYRWSGEAFVLLPDVEQQQRLAQQREQAKRYLDATDFYLTRQFETGADVPPEVRTKRAKARTLLVTQLPDFDL